MSKHPAYTALGWIVWQVGKRYAKKRAAAKARKLAFVGVLVAGAAAAAVVANAAGSER